MVGRQVLVLEIGVQIPVPEPKKKSSMYSLEFFSLFRVLDLKFTPFRVIPCPRAMSKGSRCEPGFFGLGVGVFQ